VDLLVGTNRDEWRFWSLSDAALRELGEPALITYVRRHIEAVGLEHRLDAETVVETFRSAREGRGQSMSTFDLHAAISTDWAFRVPTMRLAEAAREKGSAVYAYLFDWESPFGGGVLGSCHGLELPFVFGTYNHPMIAVFSGVGPEAEQLSNAMVSGWTSFAVSGRPLITGGPEWPIYDASGRATLRLGRTRDVLAAPMEEERSLLDAGFGPYGEFEARTAAPIASTRRVSGSPEVP
jgi:carboxylesterase type B